jgi:hypothetical protein
MSKPRVAEIEAKPQSIAVCVNPLLYAYSELFGVITARLQRRGIKRLDPEADIPF